MEEAGLPFRATKDLDIVLCIEALDGEFVQAFWQFVSLGRYQHRQRSTGERQYYRFSHPEDDTYPSVIELFSRRSDALEGLSGQHLIPIPLEDEGYYLSAILLEDECYEFILAGKEEVDGLPVVAPDHLIPLKAFAWLDLRDKRDSGVQIQDGHIRKHLRDIFRLYQLLTPETSLPLTGSMRAMFLRFLAESEIGMVDLSDIMIHPTSIEQIVGNLRRIYGCVE